MIDYLNFPEPVLERTKSSIEIKSEFADINMLLRNMLHLPDSERLVDVTSAIDAITRISRALNFD